MRQLMRVLLLLVVGLTSPLHGGSSIFDDNSTPSGPANNAPIPPSESPATQAPAPATLPSIVAPPAGSVNSSARVVDLLKDLDVAAATVEGAWTLQNGVLASAKHGNTRIDFGYRPPAEYDYKIVFSREDDGDEIGLICAAGGRQFRLAAGGWGNTTCGFDNIDGHGADRNPTSQPLALSSHQRYALMVKVRKTGVEAYLDGHLLTQWRTDFRDMASDPGSSLHRLDTVGLQSWASAYSIYSAELSEVSGSGRKMKNGDRDDVQTIATIVYHPANANERQYEVYSNGHFQDRAGDSHWYLNGDRIVFAFGSSLDVCKLSSDGGSFEGKNSSGDRVFGQVTVGSFTADAPQPNVAVADAAARPKRPQSSICALYVVHTDAGFMLGKANDLILTVTADYAPRPLNVSFVQKVGDQMQLVLDDVLRYMRLRYPEWNVAKAELTFEDKYDSHDGGSIGAAIGTLMLSTIQNIAIDPKTAITGDVSADGKIRAIGGVAAKLRGAAAAGCDVVAVPESNEAQVLDGVIYNGISMITEVQVLSTGNLDDAIAVTRADRAPALTKAIGLFSNIQARLKGSPGALRTVEMQADLRHVLDLAPQHLSAKLLLTFAANTQPRTLSASASLYYTFLAVKPMLEILKLARPQEHHDQIPAGLSTSLESLRRLRPIADPQTRRLIAAWLQFINTWNAPRPSAASIIDRRNDVVEEMQKLNADNDLMQKMMSEGI